MVGSFEEKMMEKFGERFQKSYPMAEYTSFKIGGPADFIVFPITKEEIRYALEEAKLADIPYIILGCGTNVLVKDGGLEGIVISTKQAMNDMEVYQDSEKVYVLAGCGVRLSTLVREVSEAGGKGIECLAGIPGNVGGAIKTNAGTKEGSISQFVKEITVYDEKGKEKIIPSKELNFSYRKLSIPKKWAILSAKLEFEKTSPELTKERVKEILEERMRTQPYNMPSAGCVFKNPRGLSAGKIIDELGLKGMRVRGARISPLHGNFIVNEGNAKARDVLALIDAVHKKVKEEMGISLELEVEIIGREE
jgi:UDP-N-acetylmuramate dehydrogenase